MLKNSGFGICPSNCNNIEEFFLIQVEQLCAMKGFFLNPDFSLNFLVTMKKMMNIHIVQVHFRNGLNMLDYSTIHIYYVTIPANEQSC